VVCAAPREPPLQQSSVPHVAAPMEVAVSEDTVANLGRWCYTVLLSRSFVFVSVFLFFCVAASSPLMEAVA
jgi:hypothetical protein